MATQYGLTPTGFIVKQQQDIITEIGTSLQGAFGANINLGAESVFGQIVGIFSEREALIWQLGDAIYASQYPTGAMGTSVDNILALNNLKRLKATPTKTNNTALLQANGITLYGLLLFGVAGTTIPAGSNINNGATPPADFTLDNSVVISAAVNAVQQVFFSNTPTTGTFTLAISDPAGNTLTTESLQYNNSATASTIVFGSLPGSSTHFGLTLTRAGAALTTANITTNSAYPTAAAMQSAIQALAGYSGVTVAGSAGSYTISWGSIAQPLTTVANNTTTVTITPTDSIQAAFNNLLDSSTANYPYTDVVVSGTIPTLNIQFGSGTAVGSNPVSSSQPQALMLAVGSGLMASTTVTNLNVINNSIGSPAQGIGSATCTATGPNFVKAGTLTTIGSPKSGWTGVTNQLDCITGTNVETDTQALQRRQLLLAAQANGPIQAIVEKVLEVPGVTAALGFTNTTGAAQQVLNFSSTPSTGVYTLTISGQTTANIAFGATTSQIASAINALSKFGSVIVTGTQQFGFVINFNGANGGQSIDIMTVASNTTGVTITPSFGRPPKSFEIVASGGSPPAVSLAIYDAMPAGINPYSSPIASTTGSVVVNSNQLTLSSVTGVAVGQAIFGPGINSGTTVSSIVGSTVTMSLAALGTYSSVNYIFNNTITINDAFGNPTQIGYSLPTEVPFYVAVTMVTDQYNTPGVSSSGINPQSKFNAQSVQTIQTDIITIGNAVPINGTVIGFGTNGLIGAFNSVPGIISYTLYFGTAVNPMANTNVTLQADQQPVFESFNVSVSYT